ncbi:hypothetical protein HYALB_00003997 [Hymenoscyphus albidus]|uniref:CENP-V/GFA domain-containing protein n=1 Tax=Hymenoscyphus albidus TaxID=595503 RepID=A0A9N9QAF5_9HELO|nr:hypothetical protein HYALB_00003997 [Hymenoscyphus albidus]
MSQHHPLHGGCSCGRNKYTVSIPHDAAEVAQVFFDSSAAHRRSQAVPLSAWLRIPLSWYESNTFAFFDDESHNSIRRTYTSPREQNTQRQFCGFCGTPLSYWTETPNTNDKDFISLTLGSLANETLRDLEELGLLPKEALEDVESDKQKTFKNVVPVIQTNTTGTTSTTKHDVNEGLPWFETLVEGSKLGRMSKGRRKSTNPTGRYTIEWEIVEWTDDGDAGNASPTKRKHGDLEEDDTKATGIGI